MIGEKIIEEKHEDQFRFAFHHEKSKSLYVVFEKTEKIINLDTLKIETVNLIFIETL